MNYNISDIYKEMELHLIESMKRNLSRHLKEEGKEGFEWPQWQAEKLKELKRYQRQNADIIGETENQISKTVSKLMRKQFKEGTKNEKLLFKIAKTKGYTPQTNIKNSFFGIDDRKMNNLIKSVNNDLKNANVATLRMVNDEYRRIIHKASMFATSGVMTPQQAIDMATHDFFLKGINSIVYKDGKRVNIASYSQMAVRTAAQRAYLQAEGEFRKKIGNSLVKIPAHGSSCELCAKFEGKILIDDVYSGGSKRDGKYTLLSSAMEQGLFHPNCQHPITTYYKELEDIKFDDNGPSYETMKQYQENLNYCNLQIQKFLRLETGSLDETNIKYYSNLKEEWKNKKDKIIGKQQFLQEIVREAKSILPDTFIEKTKGVKISTHDQNYSVFSIKDNTIKLGKNSDVYDLIHELGHVYDEKVRLFNNKEFVNIISDKFKKYSHKDFKMVKYKNGVVLYHLKDSSKFVNEYQTTLYSKENPFTIFGKVKVKNAKEYFSEGLRYYYYDRDLLKEKDSKLYKYINKIMGDLNG